MKTLLSILCNNKVKNSLILIFLLFIYIFISAFSYVNAVCSDIESSVFRLHVIANSDSIEDQTLKYKVRDSLIEYMNNICSNAKSKEDAKERKRRHRTVKSACITGAAWNSCTVGVLRAAVAAVLHFRFHGDKTIPWFFVRKHEF